MKIKGGYFSRGEVALWLFSVISISIFFIIFDKSSYFNLITSLIGVTAVIFCAKGNPIGQLLILIFGLLYGIISYSYAYYGEMITYVGMTCPMAVVSLVSWLRHPYKGNKNEVEISTLAGRDYAVGILLSLLVTVVFYFVLDYFNTANLYVSTLSVTTSFFAVFLTAKRSPLYALAYAANDIILIILWLFATFKNSSYISVVACFSVFLINDIYGYINWNKMQKKQKILIDLCKCAIMTQKEMIK